MNLLNQKKELQWSLQVRMKDGKEYTLKSYSGHYYRLGHVPSSRDVGMSGKDEGSGPRDNAKSRG